MISLKEALKIANIHADRLQAAAKELEGEFPIFAHRIENLSLQNLAMLELYTSRFAKLQDHLGQNVFGLLLESLKELDESMSFMDKLHRLEKLHIIANANKWYNLREIRNHISHEYPDNPVVMADNLNLAFDKRFILLDCLKRVNEAAANLQIT